MITKVDKHIAKVIRERRIARCIRQEDLAEVIGLTRISMVNIEACRQSVMPSTLYILCHALGLKPNDLFPPIKKTRLIVKNVPRIK